jgi:hypothetical protein
MKEGAGQSAASGRLLMSRFLVWLTKTYLLPLSFGHFCTTLLCFISIFTFNFNEFLITFLFVFQCCCLIHFSTNRTFPGLGAFYSIFLYSSPATGPTASFLTFSYILAFRLSILSLILSFVYLYFISNSTVVLYFHLHCPSVSLTAVLFTPLRSDALQGSILVLCPLALTLPLGPIQPPIQWYRGSVRGRKTAEGVKLTTHLHLVPSLRMSGAIPPPSPRSPSWP